MASSIFVWPGLFSFNGTTIVFPGSISIGSALQFNGVQVASVDGSNFLVFAAKIRPSNDNAQAFGDPAFRWSTGYFGTSLVAPLFANTNATNGQSFNGFQTLTELTTIAAAATTDTTIQMPATSVVLAVTVRVTTVIPTAATFTVGDSGSATRFSTAAVSSAANSTDPGTKAGAYYNASALSVRITPNAQPADNTGRVRVTIYYYTVTPSTS